MELSHLSDISCKIHIDISDLVAIVFVVATQVIRKQLCKHSIKPIYSYEFNQSYSSKNISEYSI